MGAHTETIEWRRVSDEMPDADQTVLIYDPELDGETVWLGWRDSDEWYTVDSFRCWPTHWAPMPSGPTV